MQKKLKQKDNQRRGSGVSSHDSALKRSFPFSRSRSANHSRSVMDFDFASASNLEMYPFSTVKRTPIKLNVAEKNNQMNIVLPSLDLLLPQMNNQDSNVHQIETKLVLPLLQSLLFVFICIFTMTITCSCCLCL